MVVPYAHYLIHGLSASNNNYLRSSYAKDSAKSIDSSFSYLGLITSVEETEGRKEAIIDHAVKVSTVSDKIRFKKKAFWTKVQKICQNCAIITCVGGLASGIAALTLGVSLLPLWPLATLIGLLALGFFGFSGWNLQRSLLAKEQVEKWKDCLNVYQKQRRSVHQKGFYHAFQNGYANRIVSLEELKSLWQEAMEKWKSTFVNKNHCTLSDINTFMQQSPLQSQALSLVFGSAISPFYVSISKKYHKLKNTYDTQCHHRDQLVQAVREEQKKASLENENDLNQNLAPCQYLLQAKREELNFAIHERRRCERPFYDLIERSERLETVYRAMTAPARRLHALNQRRIDFYAKRKIRLIRKRANQTLKKFYRPIRTLLEDLFLAQSQPHLLEENCHTESRAVEENATNVLPRAPELQKDLVPADYNPSWSEFVAEVDWEKGILRQTRTLPRDREKTTTEVRFYRT